MGGGEVGSWGCTSFVSTTISARSQSGQSRSPQNRNFCAQHMTEKRSVSVHGARKREGVENRAGGRVVSASVASAARWAGGDELHRLAFTAHEPVSSQAPVLHPKESNSAGSRFLVWVRADGATALAPRKERRHIAQLRLRLGGQGDIVRGCQFCTHHLGQGPRRTTPAKMESLMSDDSMTQGKAETTENGDKASVGGRPGAHEEHHEAQDRAAAEYVEDC